MTAHLDEIKADGFIGNSEITLGADLLRGADQIAEFIFGDRKYRRKIYHIISQARHGMPYFKMGSTLCARKSSLLRWIEDQERSVLAKGQWAQQNA